MPDSGNDRTSSADEDELQAAQRSTERAHQQSKELRRQIAELADKIADSEDRVAATLEQSAALRPHASERLLSAAADARQFAAHEREHSRSLRGSDADSAPTDPGSSDGGDG